MLRIIKLGSLPMPNLGLGGGTQRQSRKVHMITVRRVDGTSAQARIDREFTGAIVRPNDRVTLWGTYKNGVLLVSRGNNETANAQVTLKNDFLGSPLGIPGTTAGLAGVVLLALFVFPEALKLILGLAIPVIMIWIVYTLLIKGHGP